MAPKKKVPDAFTPLNDQVVRGWPFRVRGDGLVTVGTAAGGAYARWTFKLTTYADDARRPHFEQVAVCRVPSSSGLESSDHEEARRPSAHRHL